MLIDNNKAVVDSLELFRQSKWHRGYDVEDVFRYIIAPIKHNKLRLYYQGDKPIGLITWCWLDKEAGEKFLTFNYLITEKDYVSDDKEELWGIEFIAPYGHTKQIMNLNRICSHPIAIVTKRVISSDQYFFNCGKGCSRRFVFLYATGEVPDWHLRVCPAGAAHLA